MPKEPLQQTEAVFLFNGDTIAREMLYPEFEAILDGFVPVAEHAGGTVKGVYALIDGQLRITATVFFLLDFDADGRADPRWNIPFEQLLSLAAKGPNLGAGPIKLACFSQCPIAWQQKNLWDPQMDPARNSFILMRKAAERNRLGLIVQKPEPEQPASTEEQRRKQLQKKLHERYSQALRDRMAQMLREQRLRVTTLHGRHTRRIQSLQQEHQKRLAHYRERLKKLQDENREWEQRYQALKENLDGQAQKIQHLREYFSHKLKAAHSDEESQIQALHKHYELELSARVQKATSELQERLDMREMELFYRQQQENSLKEQVARLREEKESMLNQGADQLLDKLGQAGISFVTFMPGLGHITVAPDDMASYLDDPQEFAAARCGVDRQHYDHWLDHSALPQCRGRMPNGKVCGQSVPRVEHPSDFHLGESDRCPLHQDVTATRAPEITTPRAAGQS